MILLLIDTLYKTLKYILTNMFSNNTNMSICNYEDTENINEKIEDTDISIDEVNNNNDNNIETNSDTIVNNNERIGDINVAITENNINSDDKSLIISSSCSAASSSSSSSATAAVISSSGSDQESENDYDFGGYYSVTLGEIINCRYFVLRKFGWGYSSTVWLAWDLESEKCVILKIMKASESIRDEINCLSRINIYNIRDVTIPTYLEYFTIVGINGEHDVIVFDFYGISLLKILRLNKVINIENMKNFTRQILENFSYLHNVCKILHADVKPENIIVQIHEIELYRILYKTINSHCEDSVNVDRSKVCNNGNRIKVSNEKINKIILEKILIKCKYHLQNNNEKDWELIDKLLIGETIENIDSSIVDEFLTDRKFIIIDYGNSYRLEDDKIYMPLGTRHYRAPEVLLGLRNYTEKIDIWAIGCMLLELATGGTIVFNPHEKIERSNYIYNEDECHLLEMIELLGPFNRIDIRRSKIGRKLADKTLYQTLIDQWRKANAFSRFERLVLFIKRYNDQWADDEIIDFVKFVDSMLLYSSAYRISAREALRHKWLEV